MFYVCIVGDVKTSRIKGWARLFKTNDAVS